MEVGNAAGVFDEHFVNPNAHHLTFDEAT